MVPDPAAVFLYLWFQAGNLKGLVAEDSLSFYNRSGTCRRIGSRRKANVNQTKRQPPPWMAHREQRQRETKQMIVLITGPSHTGKTLLAQKLLEKYKFPYLSMDHLKMGLIRSGYTRLTPEDDDVLTGYLWPVVREIVKTAIENQQNLIVEGCYIPFDWAKDFEKVYLDQIRYYCLVMSESYIKNHFASIQEYTNVMEKRLDDQDCTLESVLKDHAYFRECAQKHHLNVVLIDDKYDINIDLE